MTVNSTVTFTMYQMFEEMVHIARLTKKERPSVSYFINQLWLPFLQFASQEFRNLPAEVRNHVAVQNIYQLITDYLTETID